MVYYRFLFQRFSLDFLIGVVQLWWVAAAEEVDATNGRDKVLFSHETQEKGKLL